MSALNTKILGAGSIGNHLANAARTLGWQVSLCDADPAALERARDDIYPTRYGKWDESIGLYHSEDCPRSGHDIIMIGTPPDSHLPLAMDAIAEGPRAILVEKPLCTPNLGGADAFARQIAQCGIIGFVGYNHVVGKAVRKASDLLARVGKVETMDVEFREHWRGIFAAHPWLAGPRDSYLAFWERGGGACGEHSHAINLWQHFARTLGAGRVSQVSASLDYVRTDGMDYDKLCLLNLASENGLVGRVVQDVVTLPPRKWARIQGENGHVEVQIGFQPGADAVHWQLEDAQAQSDIVEKSRADDFIEELRHVESAIDDTAFEGPIGLTRGLETMLVISAAHLSCRERRTVRIDYDAGWTTDALHVD